jgi:ParB family chromosome partitioning protein
MSVQKGLGRGLGALLGDYSEPSSPAAQGGAVLLPLQSIEPNPLQPRRTFDPEALQALADSILEHGMIQPITVRRMDSGLYQIIAGERRWRAARMAGCSEVPVVVIEADDKKAMELALIENLQRQDLNPIEEAQGYQTLIREYGLTQEQAASRVGKSRPAVANSLRLLALAPEVRGMVSEGTLSAGHAKAVLMLGSAKQQLSAAQRIVAQQLSVRQAESLCRLLCRQPRREPEYQQLRVDYIAECEKSLSRKLGRGVRIVSGKRKGRFELEFYGQDDLQRLLEALQSMKFRED